MSFIYKLDEEEKSGGDVKLPNLEYDVIRAKMFLQKHSSESGECLYDHLAELLEKILSERPRNVVDNFEDYSKKLKDERYKGKANYLREDYVAPVPCEEAKKLMELHQNSKNKNETGDEIEDEGRDNDPKRESPDLMELFFNLEQIDVGLSRVEIVALDLSIRKLVADKPIQNVKFWGKIIGKPQNYYIVEVELLEEELLARRTAAADAARTGAEDEEKSNENERRKNSEAEEEKKSATEILTEEETSSKLQLTFPPLPMNLWKESPVVPSEEIGRGTNSHIYFVCNSPGLDDWTELPFVTPQQIVAARQISRTFTGQLDTPIHTFPSFPGTERNYLRAQIERISAGTHVSPIGFFTFGEIVGEEEDDEEVETEVADEEDATETGPISENRHYVPPSLGELIDPAISNWCHHRPYILEQGRTVWWDPSKESRENEDETIIDEGEVEDEEDEQEDIEAESRGGEFKKESGPPLLTPLSEDAKIGPIVAWTARASSIIKTDRTAIAMLRSNVWPGSFTFATGKRFANVYIGTGQKFNPCNYSPPGMPMIQEQYTIGPEVMEIQDPSFEAEEAYRLAHLPSTKPESLGEEEEDEEEEDDDDEDDDED